MNSNLPGPEAAPRPPFTVGRACLWMLLGVLTYVALAVGFATLNPESLSDTVSQGLLSSCAFILVTASLAGRYLPSESAVEALGLRPIPLLMWPLSLSIGALAQVPAERLHQWLVGQLPLSEEELARAAQVFAHEGVFEALVLALTLTVVVPIAEEAFFRGAVYGGLRRQGSSLRTAGLVTALGFTLCHPQAHQILPILLVALIFTSLRVASASLLPSILAHAAFNGMTVSVHLIPGTKEAFDISVRTEALLSGALVFLLLLFVLLAKRSEKSRLAHLKESDNAA